MADKNRVRRVGDLIQQVLAEMLMREVSDPRLQGIHLTDVEVSRDLAHAKVFFAVIGDAQKAEDALQAFSKAKGFLRKGIAKQCDLRITPDLHFFHDDTSARGQHLSSLIDQAVQPKKDD